MVTGAPLPQLGLSPSSMGYSVMVRLPKLTFLEEDDAMRRIYVVYILSVLLCCVFLCSCVGIVLLWQKIDNGVQEFTE
jgi:hypothetical protein